MQTENLKALRELRIQEKAIKASIDSISDAATQEAVDFLAAQGLVKGKPSTGAQKPRKNCASRTSSKDVPQVWQVSSRPSSNSIPTKSRMRSN